MVIIQVLSTYSANSCRGLVAALHFSFESGWNLDLWREGFFFSLLKLKIKKKDALGQTVQCQSVCSCDVSWRCTCSHSCPPMFFTHSLWSLNPQFRTGDWNWRATRLLELVRLLKIHQRVACHELKSPKSAQKIMIVKTKSHGKLHCGGCCLDRGRFDYAS